MYKTTGPSTWTHHDHFGEAKEWTDEAGLAAVKGMESARNQRTSDRTKRKPPPLIFHGTPRLSSKPRLRTNSSNALQEAALKSATSLFSVMSDVFRSPNLSAHSRSSKAGLLNVARPPSRPRAHTAPPIPLAEGTKGITMDLAELPGSMPGDGTTFASPSGFRTCCQHLVPNYLDQKIERPHSSPQERTNMTPGKRERVSIESFYRDSSPGKPLQLAPWSDALVAPPRSDVTLPSYDQVEAKLDSGNKSATTGAKRPALSVLPVTSPGSGLTTPLLTSLPGSMNAVPQLRTSSQTNDLSKEDTHAVLLEQISSLRVSHDAHLKSLKAAHQKEIACHESYISFLERRQRIDSNNSDQDQTSMTTGSERQNNSLSGTVSPESSFDLGSTIMGSDESIIRKPVLHRKEHADALEVRKERDELERKISQLKAIVRKTKAQEKALQNAVLNLEGRLVEANTERIDVLEGYHEAKKKLQDLALREQALKRELQDLRSSKDSVGGLTVSSAIERSSENQGVSRNRHYRTYSDVGAVSIRSSKLLQQVYDLQRTVEERDARIRQLEEIKAKDSATKACDSTSARSLESDRIRDLEKEVETYKHLHAVAKADSERYNSLLHNEMRRQIRNTSGKGHAPIPQVEAEALSLASNKIEQLKVECENDDSSKPAAMEKDDLRSGSLVASLERELQHCIKEIILYKWDVKGYKKDLKNAHAKIESLEGRHNQTPPTTDTQPPSNAGSYTSVSSHRKLDSNITQQAVQCTNPRQFGLGVSILETPRAVEHISQVITSPPRSSTVSSPPVCAPRPSLGIHKKLPKPPPCLTPGFSPLPDLRQVETRRPAARSLSENVIAYQIKGASSDLDERGRTPLSDPNTSRKHASGSPPLPLSRFTSMSFTDRRLGVPI